MTFFKLTLLALTIAAAALSGHLVWGDEIIWGTLGESGDYVVWGS